MTSNQVYRIKGIGYENIKLGNEPIPKPAPGQALLRIHALSLNARDIQIAAGTYGGRTLPNIIPICDGAGEVVEVGEGVTKVKKGDRVTPNFGQKWLTGPINNTHQTDTLGGDADGLAGQYVLAKADTLVHIPEHLSYEEAATLTCAAVTAWNCLFEGPYPVQPGQTVLIEGTGGVSIFGLQIAVAAGARVIVTSSSNEKLKKAKQLGASDTINYKETPNWEDKVLELTNGQGVDHIIEVGGVDSAHRALKAVRVGGNIHVAGAVAGWDAGFPLGMILFKAAIVRGIQTGSVYMFEKLMALIRHHKLKPAVDNKVFEFNQLQDALRYLESGAHFGKIVVRVN